jgi:putative SOS response-associated peptidase YedK
MCGRFAQGDTDAIYSRYRVTVSDDIRKQIRPRYNIAPSQMVPVIYQNVKRKNRLALMRWGLIPSWAKDPQVGYKMINARSETVATKPSFKAPFKSQRCLVPSTGFYEWEKTDKKKIPHFIHIKDGSIFSFAALYDKWKDAEGKLFKTFTILTTDSNKLIEPIHERMPVILEEDEEKDWISKDIEDTDFLQALLDPYPVEDIQEHEVSAEVNSPRNEGKILTKPVNKLL